MTAPRFVAFADGLFRSPLPMAREIAAFADLGGHAVVDLTQRSRATIERACRRRYLLYSKYSLPYDFTAEDIDGAARFVLQLRRPVLVHCFHGRDRTGAVVERIAAITAPRPARPSTARSPRPARLDGALAVSLQRIGR